jgi:hypothetical protein
MCDLHVVKLDECIEIEDKKNTNLRFVVQREYPFTFSPRG